MLLILSNGFREQRHGAKKNKKRHKAEDAGPDGLADRSGESADTKGRTRGERQMRRRRGEDQKREELGRDVVRGSCQRRLSLSEGLTFKGRRAFPSPRDGPISAGC